MLPDAFGCVVANRFGNLLDDDADPLDLISEVELEKEKMEKLKKKKKKEEENKRNKQKKPGQKESQRDRRVPTGVDGPDLGPVCKQPAYSASETDCRDAGDAQRRTRRPAAAPSRLGQDQQPLEFSVSRTSYTDNSDIRGRGGMRGRRGARGGGYTRNVENSNLRSKREYDRHNGSGVSPEEKRGGRGPWNWGCVDEAGSEVMEVAPDATAKTEEPQITVEANLDQATGEEDKEMVVQVAMEMTLDEWKALQETNRSKAEFNIRKAVDKIPSKAKVIHQSKRLQTFQQNIEHDGNFLRRSVNDITSMLDINFGSLGRPSRGGQGRGSRGGQSTRPERVRPIIEQEDCLVYNPDDPEDFPALSAGR